MPKLPKYAYGNVEIVGPAARVKFLTNPLDRPDSITDHCSRIIVLNFFDWTSSCKLIGFTERGEGVRATCMIAKFYGS